MSVFAWIILGLIAGFIASKIVNSSGQGLLLDMVLGIVGAVVGGYLFTAIGVTGITGFTPYGNLIEGCAFEGNRPYSVYADRAANLTIARNEFSIAKAVKAADPTFMHSARV